MTQEIMSTLSGLASVAKLPEFLRARSQEVSPEAPLTFEAFAVALGQAVRGLETERKAAALARYEVDADAVRVDGQEWRKCLARPPQTSRRASGPLTVARNLSRPAEGGKCLCPRERRAGIIGGLYPPVLARQVTDLRGHMTADETSKVFTARGIAGPSRRRGERLPTRLSAGWERQREPWEGALRHQAVVAAEAVVVAVSLDGVMVPDQDAQRAAKATREAAQQQGVAQQCRGPAGSREGGCGTVTLGDEDAKRLDTVRSGRAPEEKPQTLTAQLEAARASRRAVRPDVEIVALADGAEEPWRSCDQPVYEHATKIGDHGHARQHLRAAMAAYSGEKRVEGRAEYARLRSLLRDHPGGADDVIAAISRLTRQLRGKLHKRRRTRLHAELTYCTNQRNRMDYADDQARGLPIGRGMVEAAGKTLATQRLQRSGMRWRDGQQAMRTRRSLQQSNRWAAAWALRSAHFRVGVMEVRQHGHLRALTLVQKAA